MLLKRRGVVLAVFLLVLALALAGCSTKETVEQRQLVVHGDTINSHLIEDAICVQNSRFERGQRLVFRATVNDAATGELIKDAKMKVVLSTGDEFEMVLGEHGSEKTEIYTYGFTIPDDFPTGTIDYKYVAEVGEQTATFEPFNVSLSKLTVLEKSN